MLGRRRGRPGPQHVNDPVHGHQGRPLHREQLQQRAGLAAADLAIGQLRAGAADAESPGQTQLDLRGTGRCDGNLLPHQHFLPPLSSVGKSRGLDGQRSGRAEQVPPVARDVAEYDNAPVCLRARRGGELGARCFHALVRGIEVVHPEEEPDTSGDLVPDDG